jgi:hypothetical protein
MMDNLKISSGIGIDFDIHYRILIFFQIISAWPLILTHEGKTSFDETNCPFYKHQINQSLKALITTH